MVWLESFCPADASVVGVRAGVCSGVRAARPFQGPGLLLGIGPIFGPSLFISSGTFRPSIYDSRATAEVHGVLRATRTVADAAVKRARRLFFRDAG